MKRYLGLALIALVLCFVAVGAAWDAPQTPARTIEFFEVGQRFYLETFADGYQAVKLDEPTEQALRATRTEPEFRSQVHRVIRRGDDFIHFRTDSDQTDVIVPISAIRRLSYRVENRFD